MDANHTRSRICRFGSDCWYQHEMPVCRFFQRGRCREGHRCRYRHVLVPKRDTQTEDPEEDQEAGAPSDGADVTCSICIENIWEKRLPKHKTFGILPNCTHVFCEPCIATWRRMDGYGPDVVKGCPVCRVRSDFYLPSGSMVEGEAKQQLAISSRQRCREDFCSFQAESGLCPFEEDCRYLTARSLEYQDQEEEEGESDDDDVQFFTLIVRMGEENLSRFLDEARNNPETLREFMMRFL